MKFFQGRRKSKLQRQWEKYDGLPSEAIHTEPDKSEDVPLQFTSSDAASHEAHKPLEIYVKPDKQVATHPDVTGDMMVEIDKTQKRLRILYILLGVSLVTFIVGLILLIVYSC